MSLSIRWGDGQTYFFQSRVRSDVRYDTRLVSKLRGSAHVLRTVPSGGEPEASIVLKIARDAGEIAALEMEAGFYTKQLKDLQGKAVPRFYGIYHGHIDGTPVACMLLEFCTPSRPHKLSTYEQNRKVMLAACAVHAAGVMHCDLDDGQQFIFSGNDVRMVDFGCAVPHRCPGATPTLHGEIPTGCRELVMLERNYGIHSGDSFPIVNAPVAKLPTGNPLQVLARRFGGIMG